MGTIFRRKSVRIGISDYAQNSLGDIVFVENPEEGDEVTAGETMGSIEYLKPFLT